MALVFEGIYGSTSLRIHYRVSACGYALQREKRELEKRREKRKVEVGVGVGVQYAESYLR